MITAFRRNAILTGLTIAVCAAASLSAQTGKLSASAIQIFPVISGEVKLPPEFQMAVYENLIARIKKTGRFQQVFRAGDTRAASVPDLVVMREELRDFKEGSERMRDVTSVTGATTIKLRLQISRLDGKLLLDRDVQGKVRFYGANLRATDDLAKDVAKMIREIFETPAAAAKPAGELPH